MFGKQINLQTKQDWNDIRQYYLSFGEGPWLDRHRPMLDLITWIEREGLAETLYGKVGLSGLWISDQPSSPFRDGNMLQISMATADSILFEYHRVPGSSDGMKKTVPTTEAVECLRQFLAYKFGIHRPSKNSGPDGPPNGSPRGIVSESSP